MTTVGDHHQQHDALHLCLLNWVQTIPGKGWWVYLRFCAPTKAYFDKSWAVTDFKKASW